MAERYYYLAQWDEPKNARDADADAADFGPPQGTIGLVSKDDSDGITITDGPAGQFRVDVGDADTSELDLDYYYAFTRVTLADGQKLGLSRYVCDLIV